MLSYNQVTFTNNSSDITSYCFNWVSASLALLAISLHSSIFCVIAQIWVTKRKIYKFSVKWFKKYIFWKISKKLTEKWLQSSTLLKKDSISGAFQIILRNLS